MEHTFIPVLFVLITICLHEIHANTVSFHGLSAYPFDFAQSILSITTLDFPVDFGRQSYSWYIGTTESTVILWSIPMKNGIENPESENASVVLEFGEKEFGTVQKLHNIKFMIFDKTGRIHVFDRSCPKVSMDTFPVVDIVDITCYSQENVGIAMTKSGGVVTWGNEDRGGNSSGIASALAKGVTKVVYNSNAFAALKDDGAVITWGSKTWGGNSTAVEEELSRDVKEIYQSQGGFVALKTNGQVVTWGVGFISQVSNEMKPKLTSGVTKIFLNSLSFAGLKDDNSVVSWGNLFAEDVAKVENELSGDVVQIVHDGESFAALKKNGSVVTWDRSWNNDVETIKSKLTKQVTMLYSFNSGFAAQKENGELLLWGDIYYRKVNGDISSGVLDVYSAGSMLVAIKDDKSAVTWGSFDGSEINALLVNIERIETIVTMYSGTYFFAFTLDAKIIIWTSEFGEVIYELFENVESFYRNEEHFAAITKDDKILYWKLSLESIFRDEYSSFKNVVEIQPILKGYGFIAKTERGFIFPLAKDYPESDPINIFEQLPVAEIHFASVGIGLSWGAKTTSNDIYIYTKENAFTISNCEKCKVSVVPGGLAIKLEQVDTQSTSSPTMSPAEQTDKNNTSGKIIGSIVAVSMVVSTLAVFVKWKWKSIHETMETDDEKHLSTVPKLENGEVDL